MYKNDGPAVGRGNLRGVGGHGANAVGDRVEDFAHRLLADRLGPCSESGGTQPLSSRRIARAEVTLLDAAVADQSVTGGAIDVEPLLAASISAMVTGMGNVVAHLPPDLPAVEMVVGLQAGPGQPCPAPAAASPGRRRTAGWPPAAGTSAGSPCPEWDGSAAATSAPPDTGRSTAAAAGSAPPARPRSNRAPKEISRRAAAS